MNCFWCDKKADWHPALELVYDKRILELDLEDGENNDIIDIEIHVRSNDEDYNLCLMCLKKIINAWLRRIRKGL